MKYPYDVYTSKKKNSTFSIEPHFTANMEESPMKVFDETFSRYVFTVISNGSAGYFNVRIGELPAMRKKTDYAFNKDMEQVATPATAASGPAPATRAAASTSPVPTPWP